MKKNIIQQYLDRYAEVEATLVKVLLKSFHQNYEQCLVIPAFNETKGFIERFIRHPKANKTLLIVVINQSDIKPTPENLSLFEFCNKELSNTITSADTYIKTKTNLHLNGNILVVDRFQNNNSIPKKQGVGLARKIGCDLALALFHHSKITSPWIYSSDADAHLPSNYFDRKMHPESNGAFIFDFQHIGESNDITEATSIYESAIKYFANALRACGSPYGYCSLGSCLAIAAESYAKVRGFPTRAGGEDFYLLNKIAKVDGVTPRKDITIEIDARVSNRVPFGTGPAVEKIITSEHGFTYYNPQLFRHLKEVLIWIQSLSIEDIQKSDAKTFLELENISSKTQEALLNIGFNAFIQHAQQQCKTKDAFLNHFHSWFDAFKTLKLLHHLQSTYYPAVIFSDIDVEKEIKMLEDI